MPRRYTDRDLVILRNRLGENLPVPKARKVRDPNVPSESQMQCSLIRWWAAARARYGISENLLLAIPLQAVRSGLNGARMKAEGARKGTPDLFLAVPRDGKAGIWVEMKSAVGVVSPEQRSMIDALAAQGYETAVCRSTDEAIAVIEDYLTPL